MAAYGHFFMAANKQKRKPRGRGHSYYALVGLIDAWSLAGDPSNKCLPAVLEDTLGMLDAHDELHRVTRRLTAEVRAQLLAMSPTDEDQRGSLQRA